MDTAARIALAATLTLIFVGAPALIAIIRRHPERRTIFALSPLALFSFLLWGALLIWAAGGKKNDGVIGRYADRIRHDRRFPLLVGALVAIGVAGAAYALTRG